MIPQWVVQQNLVNAIDYESLKAACLNNGSSFSSINIVPFSDEVPHFICNQKDPVIFYGSTTLIKNVNKQKRWKPGTWFDTENFRTSTWVQHYGKNMLNHDAEIMELREVESKVDLDLFFIKPDNDLKDFTGEILEKKDFSKWYSSISAGGFLFDETIKVVVAPPKYMGKEWRLVLVDGKVVTGSLYKNRSMRPKVCEQPENVVELAERMAAIWQPAPVFVMDICDHEDGPKIIELNCFNASGFYACDIDVIVKEVSAHLNKLENTL